MLYDNEKETRGKRRTQILKRKYIGPNSSISFRKTFEETLKKSRNDLFCVECILLDPPFKNTNISNKKRKLCPQHYREFRQKNSCSIKGCRKIIKNEKKRLCAFHDNNEERSCRILNCNRKCNQRHNVCDTCYMREYRKRKRSKRSKLREYKNHTEEIEYIGNKFSDEEGVRSVERGNKNNLDNESTVDFENIHSCLEYRKRYLFQNGISLLQGEIGIVDNFESCLDKTEKEDYGINLKGSEMPIYIIKRFLQDS